MATTRNKTSVILEQQLPDFVREEYATFIAFLKSYYEFLESSSPPTKIPFIVDIPDFGVYAQPGAPPGVVIGKGKKPYGIISTSNNFIPGEKLIQKANPDLPDEITGSAILSFYSGNATSQTAIVTSFGGTQNRFVKNYEIEGEESGVAFWPSERVVPIKAGAERVSLDVFDYKNIDETLDDYIQYIKNEFAVSLPGTLHKNTDTKTTIKNLRDFYRARGTEDSFKLLFRILYGEDAEVYLPQEDMLRASHGEWYDVSIIRTDVPFRDSVTGLVVGIDQIVGRKIKQLASGAGAIVEKATTRNYLGYTFAELELSGVTGTFNLTPISTESVGDGTHIEVDPIGMLTDIGIVDGGSNYKQGDTIAVTGGGAQTFGGRTKQAVGAISQVRTTNSVSGEVLSVDIIEPGLFYSSVPTLNLSEPHSGDKGATRFNTGPLKTVFYNDFSKYKDGNTFFAESDNRGGSSNVGGVGNISTQEGYDWTFSVTNPEDVTANSYANFITVPGVDRGLKGWWRMNQYSPEDVQIWGSQDGLLSGINAGNSSPLSNAAFWVGPLVRDIIFIADRRQSSVATRQKSYFNPTYYDPNIENTYSHDGWFGFQPTILDESGHGHHAYIAVWRGGQANPTTINLYSEFAFANTGVLGPTTNSLGTFNEGGVVLMSHDDIRHANTQSWVFWYYPYEHGRYSDATPRHADLGVGEARIITRDRNDFWSLTLNNYSDAARSSSIPGHFTDTRFTFQQAEFDNNNDAYDDVKLANSAGYFPGSLAGGIDEGGTLRLERWNMIALTMDYNDQGNGRGVANIYFFNTEDGLLLANGVSLDVRTSANVGAPSGTFGQWAGHGAGASRIVQGKGVILGENCESANGDSWSDEDLVMARGGYDEVRYYDKALTELEVVNLFRNPGGKYDKTLSGDWAILDGGTNHYHALGTANVEFLTDTTALGNKVVKFGQPHSEAGGDAVRIVYDKNISYDPSTHYKLSVRAKDAYEASSSNTVFGIIGLSNTGTRLLGHSGQDDYNKLFPLAMGVGDGTDGAPYTGSLGPEYKIYTGVFGGNTADLGLATSGSHTAAHGGNTEQSGYKTEYTWANPAELYGATGTGALYGNTVFFRPVITVNQWTEDDSTLIDYIKIEQSSDATLAASVGTLFKWPGKWLGDQGKLGTSPTNAWGKKYLEDNYYYQIYSYVIKSGLSLNQYKEVIKKLAHPSGTIMFGLVDIQLFGSVSIDTVVFADIVDLILKFYMGSESALLSEYADIPLAGRGVGYRTEFGLQKIPAFSVNLDLAHGTNPHGAGRNTPGSPGWIAWEQSPLTSPYANSHYYSSSVIQDLDDDLRLWPYDGPVNHDPGGGGPPFATSNAYTTVTNDTMIWHVKGFRTILGTAYENANVGALFTHSTAAGYDDSYWEETSGAYQHGWAFATGNWNQAELSPINKLRLKGDVTSTGDYYHRGYGITSPLGIDGGKYRYVRMKVRRIGPGGYGADSWLGACQPETKPTSEISVFGPSMGLTPTMWNSGASVAAATYVPDDRSKYVGSANTAQPSTFIIPADASPNTKSPWHILEWDMWSLGTMSYGTSTFPSVEGSEAWKKATSSTGISPQDATGDGALTGRRVGYIGFHLCFEPDNKPTGEKFEIEWIQVDDGTGWARGSYPVPAGYTIDSSSSGVGSGGIYKRLRTSESADISEQMIGDLSATVTIASPVSGEINLGAPVLYTHSEKKTYYQSSRYKDAVHASNGAIFRVSANTANNLDWIVTEIIDSETFLYDAPLQPSVGAYVANGTHPINYPSANGKFSGPVILDTDPNDNLYVGYVYEAHRGQGYVGFTDYRDPKPLMLFRLSPIANVQSSLTVKSDPHNLRSVGSTSPVRGRSNTYVAEQILWGNTGGGGVTGIMVGGGSLYNEPHFSSDDIEMSGIGSFVDFSTDAHGSLYIVGSGSQNIIKIFPAANGSMANGVGQYVADAGAFPGREIYELANTSTLDANNNVLGNWRPQHIIHGPKQSLFVACDTGYDETNRGANSVYCYHVVQTQNVATGQFTVANVYPVFDGARSREYHATLGSGVRNVEGLRLTCAGMVLDNENPPNLYYMTANTVYRIKPKGYSYQIGDAETEQIFPDGYFEDTLNWNTDYEGLLGHYQNGIMSGDWAYESNYMNLRVDSRNRLFFGGKSNLYCYSRGPNTSGEFNTGIPLYNKSNTEFSTLQVVANTQMYTANIDWDFSDSSTGALAENRISISDVVLGPRTSNSAYELANNFSEAVYFTAHGYETSDNSAKMLSVVYPNANGSFVIDDGGQSAFMIMGEDPATNTKFETDGTGHGRVNMYRGSGPGKVVLRGGTSTKGPAWKSTR